MQARQYGRRIDLVTRFVRGRGLEIGALQDPQPTPQDVDVRYVDLAPDTELRAIHARKKRRRLVPVDIVDDGETLRSVADASQDFVLSNHFLEHSIDPVGTLATMLRVVRPGGVVYFSVPDMRRTFDHVRPATSVEHLLADWRDGRGAATRAHYREVAELCERRTGAALDERVAEFGRTRFRIHFHCWTPDTLLALLVSLQRHGFPFGVLAFESNEAEIVVVLERRPGAIPAPPSLDTNSRASTPNPATA